MTQDDDVFVLVLKPVPEAIKEARDLIGLAFLHWGLDEDYPARLVVSELVTNAQRASGDGQHIVVRCYRKEDGTPVIECWDESPEPLIIRSMNLCDPSGRGVLIIDQLAKNWHVHPTGEGGKIVRVEMP